MPTIPKNNGHFRPKSHVLTKSYAENTLQNFRLERELFYCTRRCGRASTSGKLPEVRMSERTAGRATATVTGPGRGRGSCCKIPQPGIGGGYLDLRRDSNGGECVCRESGYRYRETRGLTEEPWEGLLAVRPGAETFIAPVAFRGVRQPPASLTTCPGTRHGSIRRRNSSATCSCRRLRRCARQRSRARNLCRGADSGATGFPRSPSRVRGSPRPHRSLRR